MTPLRPAAAPVPLPEADAGADTGGPPACVMVAGMHRSGTSATTGLLVSLGLHPPAPHDLVPPSASNERGHFESRSLVHCNTQLLAARDGTWSAPPAPGTDWTEDPYVRQRRRDMAAAFADAFPRRPAAWKDPRLCLTLPFWRSVLPGPQVAVLVLRDPWEVAASLRARSQVPAVVGLAMWERYVRSAVEGLAGLPTLVVRYDALLADPTAASTTLAGFLDQAGLAVQGDPRTAASFLDRGLRHHRVADHGHGAMVEDSRGLLDALAGATGMHAAWAPPALPAEPGWVDEVVRERLALEMAQRELRWTRASRAYRAMSAVWRLRGNGPDTAAKDVFHRTRPPGARPATRGRRDTAGWRR